MSDMIGVGVGILPTATRRIGEPKVDRLAIRILGAGHNSGAAPLTGDGTEKTHAANYVNESGASISVASIVSQGWTLRTTGTTDCSAAYTVNGIVEYPVGTQVGSISYTVTPGVASASADFTLSSPIPAGGTFRVSLASTITNGATYITQLGFAGLRTKEKASLLKKEAIYGVGDSIATNNGSVFYAMAAGKCPCYQASITGTTAQTYGASSAANFTKQVALAVLLGITRFASNFGTNDFGAMTTGATLKTYLLAMKSLANASGILFTQGTMLPRTLKLANITASSVTSSGNTMTVEVPDGTKFAVGKTYLTAGATQTEYNQVMVCKTIVDNTLTFIFPGSATTPATGTITLTSQKFNNTIEFQIPFSSKYAFGAGSDRGLHNADIRSGTYDGYIEMADPFEPSRDSGRWVVGSESPYTAEVQSCAIVTGTPLTNTRFQTNYTVGTSTVANGGAQFTSGVNIGQYRSANGNTAGDYTSATAFGSIPTVGDTIDIVPGVCTTSDDGTHPRVKSGAKGGQAILDNAVSLWIDGLLAA